MPDVQSNTGSSSPEDISVIEDVLSACANLGAQQLAGLSVFDLELVREAVRVVYRNVNNELSIRDFP
jgi:hypothetical protein